MGLALAAAGCGAPVGAIQTVWLEAKTVAAHEDELLASGLGPRFLDLTIALRNADCTFLRSSSTGSVNGLPMEFSNGSHDLIDGCAAAVFVTTIDLETTADEADAEFAFEDGLSSLRFSVPGLLQPNGPLVADSASGALGPIPSELLLGTSLSVRWAGQSDPINVAVTAIDASQNPLLWASGQDSATLGIESVPAGAVTLALSGAANIVFDCGTALQCTGTIASSTSRTVTIID